MIFVELPPFIAFAAEWWSDESVRRLQNVLMANPDAGDVIRGGSGIRKLRWSARGRGKHGGARVIYYWHLPGDCIYLIYAYAESEREALTPAQVKTLASLMKDIKHG